MFFSFFFNILPLSLSSGAAALSDGLSSRNKAEDDDSVVGDSHIWESLTAAADAARSLVRIKLEDSNDLLAARQALEFCVRLMTDIEQLATSNGLDINAALALLE